MVDRHVPPGDDGERCPKSQRVDGLLHSWVFDGDDPYAVCAYCGERRDALTRRTITPAASPSRTGDDLRETLAAVLAAHRIGAIHDDGRLACVCTADWMTHEQYRAHVADALADALGEAGC